MCLFVDLFSYQKCQTQELVVGDIIRVEDGQTVPCDMVLIASANPQGTCSMETSSLDG